MKYFKNILNKPSVLVTLIGAILVFLGVIYQNRTSVILVRIPIEATQTAEARLTAVALSMVAPVPLGTLPATGVVPPTVPAADWVFNPVTTHYYKVLRGCTWAECEQQALADGAHLVTINDQQEQDWLIATFPQGEYWIGFTDSGSEGNWYWVSGEPATFVNWAANEPSNSRGFEDYGEMDLLSPQWEHNGQWNDDNGLTPELAIIEKTTP